MLLGAWVALVRQGGRIVQADVMDALWGLATLGVAIYLGRKGNEWREAKLTERGFDCEGVIEAPSGEVATVRILKQRSA